MLKSSSKLNYEVQEFEDAIAETGFGTFNIILMLLSIPGTAAIIFESTTLSYVMPAAENDLKLTLNDKGRLYGVTYAGMITSAVPWAILSDTRGRKWVLILSHIFDAICVLLSACSQTFNQLLIFRFLGGLCICGGYPTLMTYIAEMHGKKYRSRFIFFLGILLTMATLTITFLAMAILPLRLDFSVGSLEFHAWNVLIVVSAIPSMICAIGFALLPESPKYLMTKNDIYAAHDVLSKLFAMNTGKPPEEYPVEEKSLLVRGSVSPISYSIRQIVYDGWTQTKPVFTTEYIFKALKVFLIDFMVLMCQNTLRLWMPQLFATVYALSESGYTTESATICHILELYETHNATINAADLKAKSFSNNLIVGATSAITYIMAILIIPKVGPKVVLSFSLGVSSIAGYVMLFATSEMMIVLITSIYLAVENISATSVANAAVSLFPTAMRNTIVASTMLFGRIGSVIGNILFPRLIAMGCLPPIMWLGTMSLENMKINAKMATPIEEKVDQNLKIRTGMVNVSDGKSKPEPLRLNLTMELLTLQKLEIITPTQHNGPPMESKERMVQITRQKQGGLGLSIKGGAEHKLPILISRIYKDQAADITGQLFVGDAIIKVNGEYITACPHDDAVNILRNAGDIVVLTVKHYRAATPFLQKQLAKDTPDSDNDATCAELKADEGYKSSVNNGTISRSCSRPMSICSEPEKKWVDVVAVPLMMAYVTRYIYGTDKLRPNAFEVRGLNGASTGIIHCDDLAILSQWLKLITDNVVGLTHLQMKLYNRNFAVGERIEYMGWVNEGVINNNVSWQSYKPRFLILKGTEVMLFESPPLNVAGLSKALVAYKVYQTMFRVVKESETVDSRQHCFLLQSSGHEPRYLSVETRQELLRIENSWNAAIVTSVIKLGRKTFAVSHHGKSGGLTLDWQTGFSLAEGADSAIVWQYKFSQLRGSSDDGKSKLKLHFQDHETRAIETKELECQVLQSLLFCMHAFLTAKVASVDPAFLSSIQQT